MKKTLIALASVAALGAAHADVTLYGVIDAGFGTSSMGLSSDVNNPSNANIYAVTTQTAANSAAGRTTSMTNGMLQPSRWGFKGTEDLGGGLTGMFTLESALNIAGGTNPNDHALLASTSQGASPLVSGGVISGQQSGQTGAGDSSLNGQMFDREASVGLKGDFGQITAGFQLNLLGEQNGKFDPLGGGYISPLGTYGGVSGMGSSFTPRASNSLKYKYQMGNTQIAAFYAMGGQNGNAGAGSQSGLMIDSQINSQLNVALGVGKMNDNVAFNATNTTMSSTGAANTTGLYPVYFNSTEFNLSAAYQATSKLKLTAGYLSYTDQSPSNGSADLNITQNLGVPLTLSSVAVVNNYQSNYTFTTAYLGAKYDIEPNQHLSVAFYDITKGSYQKAAAGPTGYTNGATAASGVLNQLQAQSNSTVFGVVYDFDLSKKSDIYFAANYQKFDNTGPATLQTAAAAAGTANGASSTQAISQWGLLAGNTISFYGVGYRLKF